MIGKKFTNQIIYATCIYYHLNAVIHPSLALTSKIVEDRKERYQRYQTRKVTAQEKLLDATSDFENVLKTIEEQKKSEFVSQLSCKESGLPERLKAIEA